MAVRPIVIFGDPVLREVSEKVEKFDTELKNLVSDMVDTLKEAQGLGLAAVQIGITKRVFITDLSAVDIHEKLRVFVNPVIVESSDESQSEYEEGCLSFPGIYQKITRAAATKIKAFDLDGNEFVMDATGLAARAILHEYDHLDGELFIDHMSTMTKTMLKGKLKKLQTAS